MPEIYKLGDAHRPELLPGRYELHVAWKVEIDGEPAPVESTEKTQFHIASERFWVDPSEIESVHPPEGSTGDYGDDLPHVVLSRDTLPWERSAKMDSDAPWLALLLFSEEEAARCPLKTTTLKTYRDTLAAYPQKVTVDLEPGQESDSVQVIEIPSDFSRVVLPKLTEISLLSHTRLVESGGKVTSSAVVAGKRLPSPGRNTAHLVMLEHRFAGEDFPLPTNGAKCLLISLKSWSFTSQAATGPEHDNHSLANAFGQLQADWLHLPLNPASVDYQKAGSVPLRHWFRTGEAGASWYGGPLNSGVPLFPQQQAGEMTKLPAQSADDLLWYDETLGMLNVTYAAAWELGRLLAMQNRSIFSLLHLWRRQQIHCHHAAEAAEKADCCHLPQIQCACAKPAPEVSSQLKEWFNRLRLLEGIPYRYLLPDERLLPPESIRFLALDQNYINALLDGVLSTVRGPSQCPEECRKGELKLLAGAHPEIVTGFLIRSAAVAGLPRLEATATGSNSQKDLDEYCSFRLSPSIRLYLFKGRSDKVVLRQRQDTIHLSVRGAANVAWSNRDQRVLAISGTSGAQFARGLLDKPAELILNVSW